MNANAETNTAPTTADIEKRIADERNRLNAELSLQSRLQAQRLPALESGNDVALDVIETNLVGCLERQSRIEERIELLTTRLAQSKSQDESDRLDELAASAERARERGIKIVMSNYPKIAKQLAQLLGELEQCEQEIVIANLELTRAKRKEIDAVNMVRFAPAVGPHGIATLPAALNEAITLPSEQPGTDAKEYWKPRDHMAEFIQSSFHTSDHIGRKLLTP